MPTSVLCAGYAASFRTPLCWTGRPTVTCTELANPVVFDRLPSSPTSMMALPQVHTLLRSESLPAVQSISVYREGWVMGVSCIFVVLLLLRLLQF
jgi:hypothetical protein